MYHYFSQAGLADVTDPDSLLAGNLGLAVFLWEAHFADEDQPDFYFGLFDLNAWYQVLYQTFHLQ